MLRNQLKPRKIRTLERKQTLIPKLHKSNQHVNISSSHIFTWEENWVDTRKKDRNTESHSIHSQKNVERGASR